MAEQENTLQTKETQMNQRIITFAILSIAIASISSAQTPSNAPGRNKGSHSTYSQASDKSMRQARKLCREAAHTLDRALHIYQGHRANAEHLLRQAAGDITDGLQGNASRNSSGDNDDARRHRPEEIAKSNQKLNRAMSLAQSALTLLQGAAPQYNGERAEAIKKVQGAISEIQAALACVSGR